jgi:hypothetical protein
LGKVSGGTLTVNVKVIVIVQNSVGSVRRCIVRAAVGQEQDDKGQRHDTEHEQHGTAVGLANKKEVAEHQMIPN